MKRLWLLLYDLVLALWVGGAALFTLLLTPALFRAFDRDRAGEVVNALFPAYFPFLLWLSAAAVALLLLLGASRSAAGRAALLLAVLAVGANAWHLWKVYPEGLAARRQVGSFVRDPPDSPARKEFRRLHGISSALNLLALVDGLVLLAFARRLRDG
jgi:uncharacterized membrane protein